MRVCLFADAQSVHTRRIAMGLRSRGIDVHVVTHKPAMIPGVGVERFRIPPPGVTHPFRWSTRRQRYLRDFTHQFDLINVQFLQDWGFTAELLDGFPFVATPWGSDIVQAPEEDAPSATLLEHRRMLLRHAAAVTAWGDAFASMISCFADLNVDSIHRVPLGVDLDLFHPDAGARLHTTALMEDDTSHIGFFKGFRAVYGPTHMLEAIPRILDRCPQTRFTLIGEGPQLATCRAMARSLGVDHSITWLPPQPHESIPRHLAGWDLTVIPSVCESFGAAALEAAAMRVPVVASRVGGLIDTVQHGVTGWHVPPQDSPALADAVINLLNDSALRHRMGVAARAFVEDRYDWNRCLDAWLDVFNAALDRHSASV